MKLNLKQKIFTNDWWTTKLSLIVRHDESFAEKHRFPFTPAKLVFFSFILFVILFVCGFLVAGKFYRQGGMSEDQAKTTQKLVELKFKVDSLALSLETKNNYLDNIKKLLGGDVKYMKADRLNEDELVNQKGSFRQKKKSSYNVDSLEQADLKLREELERKSSLFVSFSSPSAGADLKDLFLFSPIEGIVSEKYNARTGHYGVDIVSAKDEPIKSVAEGTVIMSSWTDETGYVIAVQHRANLVSVYKHCSSLLKKTGEFVKAGEIIAIIGNTGKFSSGPHLHFELWYNRNPVNPEELVSF